MSATDFTEFASGVRQAETTAKRLPATTTTTKSEKSQVVSVLAFLFNQEEQQQMCAVGSDRRIVYVDQQLDLITASAAAAVYLTSHLSILGAVKKIDSERERERMHCTEWLASVAEEGKKERRQADELTD